MTLDEEEQDYREIIKNDPLNISAWANLGKVLNEKKDHEGAIEALQKALEIDSNDTWILFELGFTYSLISRFKEAEEIYQKLVKIDPHSQDGWFNLALVYRYQLNFKGAIDAYQEVLKIDPYDTGVYLNIGVLYHQEGKIEEAEKVYRKALEIRPDYTKVSLNLGQLLLANKQDIKGAAEVFKKGFENDPISILLLSNYYKATGGKRYVPAIVTAKVENEYFFDKYRAVIIDQIEAVGQIIYDYMVLLYEGDSIEPIYYVSLERNNLFNELGGFTHFLCAFSEDGHVNFGEYELPVVLESFTKRAFDLICVIYHISKDKLPLLT
ncbi:MAG: tetratricopeptide repeat protein [Candidatus Heimdallarchaeota archaeon]|nr:tetratricopeptide repeat protein [Candidatus Heimdallarchaeota archaeon]